MWSKGATAAGASATSSSNRRIAAARGTRKGCGIRPSPVRRPTSCRRFANLADGPSGLTYDPGVTLLPPEYQNHFFLVDFRGSSGQSGIRTFALEPQGASFEVVDSQQFIWSVLATDVDFAPTAALYFSDWVEGWDMPNKGRIYRVLDESRRDDPGVREVKDASAAGDGAPAGSTS